MIWDLCARELYGLALWRTGSVADAEDAVQEVFLKLLAGLTFEEIGRGPRQDSRR